MRVALLSAVLLLAGGGTWALDFPWTASQTAYIVGVLGLTIVPVALCLATVAQLTRAPGRPTTFSAGPLLVSSIMLALSVGLIPVTYGLIVVVDVVLVPVAFMLLWISWVRPRDVDFPLAAATGVAVVPAVVWLWERAVQHLIEGLLSGAIVGAVLTTGFAMRRRGLRSPA